MADFLSSEERSKMMSRIRARDTKPEIALRKALFARGFRFRVNDRRLPGTPDLVFPKYRAVLMVHGCFWHRHSGCRKAYMPKSRVEFWQRKFEANVARDGRNIAKLQEMEWRVGVIWECAIGSEPPRDLVDRVEAFLQSSEAFVELPEIQA